MGGSLTKQSGEVKGLLGVGNIVSISGIQFKVVGENAATEGANCEHGHYYLTDNKVYYLKPIKSGGGKVKQPRARLKQTPVLYPEEGLHSKWSSPRKRSEKISVDGQAPVNFLTENIGA